MIAHPRNACRERGETPAPGFVSGAAYRYAAWGAALAREPPRWGTARCLPGSLRKHAPSGRSRARGAPCGYGRPPDTAPTSVAFPYVLGGDTLPLQGGDTLPFLPCWAWDRLPLRTNRSLSPEPTYAYIESSSVRTFRREVLSVACVSVVCVSVACVSVACVSVDCVPWPVGVASGDSAARVRGFRSAGTSSSPDFSAPRSCIEGVDLSHRRRQGKGIPADMASHGSLRARDLPAGGVSSAAEAGRPGARKTRSRSEPWRVSEASPKGSVSCEVGEP